MIETSLSRAPATRERVLHDARAVADACAAEASSVGPGRVRAVLRTKPAAHSGSASVEGVFLNADTGRFVDGSGAPIGLEGRPGITRYEGSYDVLAVLSGPAEMLSGHYSWTEPQPVHVRGITPADIYDPFGRPGVVICSYDPTAQGAPFDQVRLMPEDWHVHAAASRASQEPDAPTARAWLTSPNDLLFARAVRTLAQTGQLDPQLLESVRGQARSYRRAVLHYVTLASRQRPGGTEVLDADLAAHGEPDHRRAAALGLLSARLFAPEATAATVAGWPPVTRPGGLIDPDLVAGDTYIREAFTLLTPESPA
jgi:hypothetical protein